MLKPHAQQQSARPGSGSPFQVDMQQLIQICESGQSDKARQYALELTTKYPKQPLPHNILGSIHTALGRHAEAAENFKKALDIAPDYVEVLANLANALAQLQQFDEAIVNYRRYIEHHPKDVDAHYEIGKIYLTRGQYGEAEDWFRRSTEIDPSLSPLHSELGRCLLAQGKRDEAISSLGRALELDPDSAHIQHFYNAAVGRSDGQAPAAFVSNAFDSYAETFDSSLVDQLGYQAPTRLYTIWGEFQTGNPAASSAMDLGCGTGLVAEVFGPCSKKWTGIDLSAGMLEKARAKGIYEELIQGELTDVLNSLEEQFDLFICSDTLIYIGDISPVFNAVARRAAAGAYFLFSTEHLESGSIDLLPTGRYAHSKAYVVRSAKEAGFEVLHSQLSELRKEHGTWLTGGYYILQHQRQ